MGNKSKQLGSWVAKCSLIYFIGLYLCIASLMGENSFLGVFPKGLRKLSAWLCSTLLVKLDNDVQINKAIHLLLFNYSRS